LNAKLHRLGNSQAVVIPKPFLTQLGIERDVDVAIVGDHLEVRRPSRAPREGWAEKLSALPTSAFELTEDERAWLDMPGPEIPQW
jgi:antitoxin MazE